MFSMVVFFSLNTLEVRYSILQTSVFFFAVVGTFLCGQAKCVHDTIFLMAY